MSRPLRIEYEGAYYHIIQRGTERKNIYKEETNKEKFLKYLKEAQTRYKVRIHCYCGTKGVRPRNEVGWSEAQPLN